MAAPDKQSIAVAIDTDPGAEQYIPIFRAPRACTVEAARAIVTDNVNQTDADSFSLDLVNGGTAGSGTTVMSGTIGGTAGTPGWTGLKPEVFSISSGALTTGQVVVLHYNEEGTIAVGVPILVQLEIDY